jgi:hypothetical protein
LIKIIPRFVAAALVAAGLATVPTTPAEAANATPGCITRTEFRKVTRGTTLPRARQIIGARGRVTSSYNFSDGDAWRTVEFRQCGRSWARSSVSLSFEKTEREVWVSDVYCYDWDGDGYEEDCEDYGGYETVYRLPFVMTSKSAYWS